MPATPIPTADGTAALPFAGYADAEGNFWVSPGSVIALHGTTATFPSGLGGLAMDAAAEGQVFQPVAGQAAAYLGGNGTNLALATGPLDSVVPFGLFRPTAPDEWTAEGSPDLVLTFDSGDGSAEISDGTNVVATLGAGTRTNPAGTYTATTYGRDTYNGGSAFSPAITYEGAADTFPLRPAAVVWTDSATAQAGLWTRTGWQAWESDDDPDWTITLDGTGSGEISDGTDVVAERPADSSRLYDPTGQWEATAYGLANYGAPLSVYEATASAGTFQTQAFELTGTAGTVETWTSTTDPAVYIEFDSSDGDADLYDGGGLVAERTSGVSTADFLGTYTATTYGRTTYHGGTAFTVSVTDTPEPQDFLGRVGFLRATPAAAKVWVELTLDGSDEVTAATDPQIGSAWPANSSTLAVFPILESDGAGVVYQHQLGPIVWRPAP